MMIGLGIAILVIVGIPVVANAAWLIIGVIGIAGHPDSQANHLMRIREE